MVFSVGSFLTFIENAGVENGLYALINKPLNMAVGKLGGIAFRLRGDGLHAQLIYAPCGQGREQASKAQLAEEGGPEGIVFVNIQNSGHADYASFGFLFPERLIAKYAAKLIFKDVAALFSVTFLAETLFAAVSAYIAAASGEGVHGEHAAIGAALAADAAAFVAEIENLGRAEHGALAAFVSLPCYQRSAKCAHDAGNIGANGLRSRHSFEGAENGFIIKCAALNNYVAAKLRGVGELDNLEKGVFDNGVGKAGGNIRKGCSLFLSLLNIGVHENCASCAQIHGIFREYGLLGKGLGGETHGVCEVFYERAAAGRAGLVKEHIVHRAVAELNALHVLTAYVQNAVHGGVEKCCGGGVGYGFHFTVIKAEGGLEKLFAVARGAGAGNGHAFGQNGRNFSKGAFGSFYGVALVGGIEGIKKLAFFTYEGKLCCGGACVHT